MILQIELYLNGQHRISWCHKHPQTDPDQLCRNQRRTVQLVESNVLFLSCESRVRQAGASEMKEWYHASWVLSDATTATSLVAVVHTQLERTNVSLKLAVLRTAQRLWVRKRGWYLTFFGSLFKMQSYDAISNCINLRWCNFFTLTN